VDGTRLKRANSSGDRSGRLMSYDAEVLCEFTLASADAVLLAGCRLRLSLDFVQMLTARQQSTMKARKRRTVSKAMDETQ
jgi:hypothetical protein